MTEPIVPAEPATTADGTPYSATFDDVYHSTEGALGQARHVFLEGNGIPERWRRREQFVIVESGFGLGLNFLATWAAWRADPERPRRLHFVSVEKHPFRAADLRQMLESMLVLPGMTELAPLVPKLCSYWPAPLPGWHRRVLAPGVVLSVGFGDFNELMPALRVGADAFFLDGFAPDKNPEMWTLAACKTLGRLAREGATIATHTANAQVQRDLQSAGFEVAPQPGLAGKPPMLAGQYAPPYRMRRYDPSPAPHWPTREAIVIGAGMAGAAMTHRLSARGWRVHVFERGDTPGSAASGNPAGVFHPQMSADDNVLSRLTRAGFLYATAHWRSLPGGLPGRADGLLQVASHAEEADAMRKMMAAHAYPPEYARWVDVSEASQLAGERVAQGGVWFPHGGWLAPAQLCRSELVAAGAALDTRYGVTVDQLARRGDGWAAIDPDGKVLAEAPIVVVTAADESQRLLSPYLDPEYVPVRKVRGQLTFLPPDSVSGLRVPVCGDGYVAPPAGLGAGPITGATYGFDDPSGELRPEEHLANLRRLAALLPARADEFGPQGLANPQAAAELGGRVAFRALVVDRLPMTGQLPDVAAAELDRKRLTGGHLRDLPRLPGLYSSFAYGSRGLVWASLCAELVASQIEGEPWPVAADLADAIDPARFLMQALRRQSAS